MGTVYVPWAVISASALYGSIGVVFAILTWLEIPARVAVCASALNVLRHEQAHGAVTLDIRAPRIDGEVPLAADRGGAVAPAAPGRDERDPG